MLTHIWRLFLSTEKWPDWGQTLKLYFLLLRSGYWIPMPHTPGKRAWVWGLTLESRVRSPPIRTSNVRALLSASRAFSSAKTRRNKKYRTLSSFTDPEQFLLHKKYMLTRKRLPRGAMATWGSLWAWTTQLLQGEKKRQLTFKTVMDKMVHTYI